MSSKSSNKSAGKGMSPTKGYNHKNWYNNYDLISWKPKEKLWCAWCGVWGDHTSGGCKDLKNNTN